MNPSLPCSATVISAGAHRSLRSCAHRGRILVSELLAYRHRVLKETWHCLSDARHNLAYHFLCLYTSPLRVAQATILAVQLNPMRRRMYASVSACLGRLHIPASDISKMHNMRRVSPRPKPGIAAGTMPMIQRKCNYGLVVSSSMLIRSSC